MEQNVNQSEQQQGGDKVEKKFNKQLKQLSELLGSDKHLLPSGKVGSAELNVIVAELLKDQAEKNKKEIKEQLTTLLNGYANLKKEVSIKTKELEAKKQEKMKEFSKAADALFARVESMNQQQAEFSEGLNEATKEDDSKGEVQA